MLRLVKGTGMALAGIGVGVAVGGAVIATLLYGVAARDPPVLPLRQRS